MSQADTILPSGPRFHQVVTGCTFGTNPFPSVGREHTGFLQGGAGGGTDGLSVLVWLFCTPGTPVPLSLPTEPGDSLGHTHLSPKGCASPAAHASPSVLSPPWVLQAVRRDPALTSSRRTWFLALMSSSSAWLRSLSAAAFTRLSSYTTDCNRCTRPRPLPGDPF